MVPLLFLLTWAVFGWREITYVCPPGVACPPSVQEPAFQDRQLYPHASNCRVRAQDKEFSVNDRGGWSYDLPATETQPAVQVRWRFVCREVPAPPGPEKP